MVSNKPSKLDERELRERHRGPFWPKSCAAARASFFSWPASPRRDRPVMLLLGCNEPWAAVPGAPKFCTLSSTSAP